jgi:(4S)-4-hydroxy-5-phosphonooxypentane-2,3-dione isomerase
MPVTYVIKFMVAAGQEQRFLELLGGVLDAMRNEREFHEAILHRDPASAGKFMLYETWEDHEDVLNVQIHKPYRQAFHDALPTVLAEPRDIQVWEPIRADGASRLT